MTRSYPRTHEEWRLAFKGAYRKLDELEASLNRKENSLHDVNDGLISVRLSHDLVRERSRDLSKRGLKDTPEYVVLDDQANQLCNSELIVMSNQKRASSEYSDAINKYEYQREYISHLQQCFDIWLKHHKS